MGIKLIQVRKSLTAYVCNAYTRFREYGLMVSGAEFRIISDVVNAEIGVEKTGPSKPSIEAPELATAYPPLRTSTSYLTIPCVTEMSPYCS